MAGAPPKYVDMPLTATIKEYRERLKLYDEWNKSGKRTGQAKDIYDRTKGHITAYDFFKKNLRINKDQKMIKEILFKLIKSDSVSTANKPDEVTEMLKKEIEDIETRSTALQEPPGNVSEGISVTETLAEPEKDITPYIEMSDVKPVADPTKIKTTLAEESKKEITIYDYGISQSAHDILQKYTPKNKLYKNRYMKLVPDLKIRELSFYN